MKGSRWSIAALIVALLPFCCHGEVRTALLRLRLVQTFRRVYISVDQ